MKKKLTILAAGLSFAFMISPLTVAAEATALASPVMFEKSSDEIEYRHTLMDMLGTYTGAIGAVVKKKYPYETAGQKKKVEEITTTIAALTAQASLGFDHELASGTKASSRIWKKKADFDSKMVDMVEKAKRLNIAAATGDLSKLQAAFGDYAGTCKACHKEYKD